MLPPKARLALVPLAPVVGLVVGLGPGATTSAPAADRGDSALNIYNANGLADSDPPGPCR